MGEIRVGDVVVHEDHGIGVVGGLEPISDAEGDAIRVTYADDAVRLVPVSQADRLWRYGADADAVTLDRLDGTSWAKRRGLIDAAIGESGATGPQAMGKVMALLKPQLAGRADVGKASAWVKQRLM